MSKKSIVTKFISAVIALGIPALLMYLVNINFTFLNATIYVILVVAMIFMIKIFTNKG